MTYFVPNRDGRPIQVEITDVFTGAAGHKVAQVRALAGQPFSSWSHGGWTYSANARVLAYLIVHQIGSISKGETK